MTGYIYEFSNNPLTSHEDFIRTFRKFIPSDLIEDCAKLAKFYDKENYIQIVHSLNDALEKAKSSKVKSQWTKHRDSLFEFYINLIDKFVQNSNLDQKFNFSFISEVLEYKDGCLAKFFRLFNINQMVQDDINYNVKMYDHYQALLNSDLTEKRITLIGSAKTTNPNDKYIKQVDNILEVKLFLKELGLNLKGTEILAIFLKNKKLLFEEDMLLSTTTKDVLKILKIDCRRVIFRSIGLTKLNQMFALILLSIKSATFVYIIDRLLLNLKSSYLIFYILKISLYIMTTFLILRMSLKYFRIDTDSYVKQKLNTYLRFEGN
jgi:hypothetical protein